MTHGMRAQRLSATVALGLLLCLRAAAVAATEAPPLQVAALSTTTDSGAGRIEVPAFDRYVHRLFKRTENSTARFITVLGAAGRLWLWILLSVSAFFVVATLSSIADVRLLSLRHQPAGTVGRYVGNGVRTFIRVLRDRQTPIGPRLLLVGALLYWLVPLDLIPDQSMVPGFVDDLVIAVTAAKGFIYFCPDALIAHHAAAVEARGEATA